MENEKESTIIHHTDRGHATLGGSSALRWANCPGSVFLIKDLPPQLPTDATEEGTKAHELAEKVLENFLDHKVNGTALIDWEHDDPEMLSAALGYRDAIWTNGLEEHITGKAYCIEDQVTLDKDLDMWGYIDFWAAYIDDHGKRTGFIADFKYGFHVVSVDNNAQLAFYACALREEFRKLGKDLDRVRAGIFQPRAYGASPYKETEFSSKQLDSWKKKFIKAAEGIFITKKASFKTGEWCRFCPAQGVCKKYNEELTAKTALKFADKSVDVLPSPETLSEEQLARIVINKGAITDYLKACESYAFTQFAHNKPIKGLKIVETKGRRRWVDSEEEIIESLEALGLRNITKSKLRSISDIEKLAKTHARKEEIIRVMSSYIEIGAGSKTIVSENDERESVSVGVQKFTITE